MPARKPEQLDVQVDLDLDSLEQENPVESYRFRLSDHVLTVGDPRNVDYRLLMSIAEDPAKLLGIFEQLMSEKDYAVYEAAVIPAFKLEKLVRGFSEHYGLPTAPGEADALPS